MTNKTHKLSFSAISDYEQCPMYYKHKRILKTPNLIIASPLFFGNALDEAFSRLLLTKKKNLTNEERECLKRSPIEVFDDYFTNLRDWDKNLTYLPNNPNCDYFFSDYDQELFTKEDISNLEQKYELVNVFSEMELFLSELRDKKKLPIVDKPIYNEIVWTSLRRKGHLLVKAYEKEVLPQIGEVFDIQKHIQLTNSSNDVFSGKIDFTASFKDKPNTKFILDNKSSSAAYSADSVQNSDQLICYSEAENNSNCGFIVVEKKLRKKEPKVRVNIIKDTIKEESVEKTFDKINKTLDNIVCENFPMKESKKDCFFYGKQCPFFKHCWSK